MTVGKIAFDLSQKETPTRDPVLLEREMHKDYEKNVYECIARYKPLSSGSFYVVVLTKMERTHRNIIRHYFIPRNTCPTPNYDQTVYRYDPGRSDVEFIWTIPDRETCFTFLENKENVAPEEYGLLSFVLAYHDGTLGALCKKLNNEKDNDPSVILYHKTDTTEAVQEVLKGNNDR